MIEPDSTDRRRVRFGCHDASEADASVLEPIEWCVAHRGLCAPDLSVAELHDGHEAGVDLARREARDRSSVAVLTVMTVVLQQIERVGMVIGDRRLGPCTTDMA